MNAPLQHEGSVQIDVAETHPEIRDLVRRICANFSGSYWQKLEETQGYPEEFVGALTEAGLLGTLIPEEYGGLRHAARGGGRDA